MIKKWYTEKVDPKQLAFFTAIIVGLSVFFATVLALINPNLTFLTKFFEIMYGGFGYSVSTLGILLGTVYAFTDTFILVWIISWVYNKTIKEF
ncbi:hypothetical protein KAS08_03760 [Candidatus Pacearchaeota archaeon]|nr:hypothetical protein [Candidatus Pacearchaeota archaeon]